MDNKVARQAMAENGRKWSKMGCRGYLVGNGFPRVSRRGHRGGPEDHGRNGRKWQKMGCRGYLVGNGFPRVLRHGHRGSQEDHGRNGRKWVAAGKWQEMDFRVFCAIPLLLCCFVIR